MHKIPLKIFPDEFSNERLWSQVEVRGEDDCWFWTGCTNRIGRNGYPITSFKRKRALALHNCDTPLCVNPKHLRAGTYKDNAQDCSKRGRRPLGRRQRLRLQKLLSLTNKNVIDNCPQFYGQVIRRFKVLVNMNRDSGKDFDDAHVLNQVICKNAKLFTPDFLQTWHPAYQKFCQSGDAIRLGFGLNR